MGQTPGHGSPRRHSADTALNAVVDSPRRLIGKAAHRGLGRLVPARLFSRFYDGIPGRVHPDDAMLRSEDSAHVAHYADDARSAIENLNASLRSAGRTWHDVRAFVDLPCGYGRVTRFLVQHLDPACVTASDVDRQAVRFCAAEFGVHGVVAAHDPARTRFPRRYDVAFVGSLLTHLTADACAAVLRAIVATLEPGALLVFSTQGESCLAHLDWYGEKFASLERTYRSGLARDGIRFVPYEQTGDYGVTLHTAAYVRRLMDRLFGTTATLTRFAERGWDHHQDVWTYRLKLDKPS